MRKLSSHPTPDDPNQNYTAKEYLTKHFYYADGLLIRHSTNKPVGTLNTQGYLQVMFERKMYPVHKLIYIMHHNATTTLVHIDGNKLNNKIDNLIPKKPQVGKSIRYGIKQPKLPKFIKIRRNITHPLA
jgi:hypothetical protein